MPLFHRATRLRLYVLMAVTAVLALGFGLVSGFALATNAAPKARAAAFSSTALGHYYLALGDSEAAGEMLDLATNTDVLTTQGYSDVFASDLVNAGYTIAQINLGRTYETTNTFLNGGCAAPSGSACQERGSGYSGAQMSAAVAFLQAHPNNVGIVTLNLGINDFLPCINMQTLVVNQACASATQSTVRANIATILANLHQAAPGAILVVLNAENDLQNLSPQTTNSNIDQYDFNLLADAVKAPAYYVDQADLVYHQHDYTYFPWQSQTNPYLTALCPGCDTGADFHPNAEGYRRIAAALELTIGYPPLPYRQRLPLNP